MTQVFMTIGKPLSCNRQQKSSACNRKKENGRCPAAAGSCVSKRLLVQKEPGSVAVVAVIEVRLAA